MSRYSNLDYFKFIELKREVSVDEFAKKFSLPKPTAASWLTKWANRGYLEHTPSGGESAHTVRRRAGRPKGTSGKYKLGSKWYGELLSRSDLEFI